MTILVACLFTLLNLSVAWAGPWAVADSVVDWSQVVTLQSLTSGAYQKLDEGARGHRAGSENQGIYKFKGPDGEPRLIKVLRVPFRAGVRNPHFAEEVEGMLMAASLGGPKIYRGGRINTGEGDDLYYIDMEQAFPNEESFTLKGLYDHSQSWTSRFRPITIS